MTAPARPGSPPHPHADARSRVPHGTADSYRVAGVNRTSAEVVTENWRIAGRKSISRLYRVVFEARTAGEMDLRAARELNISPDTASRIRRGTHGTDATVLLEMQRIASRQRGMSWDRIAYVMRVRP